MTQAMNKTGILIEIENNRVKESSLGVMTAAAGHDIYALVLKDDVSALKDKLAEYGAGHVVSIKGVEDEKVSPHLVAQTLVSAVKEYEFEALLGTAGAKGKDLFARIAAILDEPLISDCLEVDITEIKPQK